MSVQHSPETDNSYDESRAAIEAKARTFRLTKALLRYVTSEDARNTFHSFLWNEVGNPQLPTDTAANPEILEEGYAQRIVAKCTRGGNLLVVRKRPGSQASFADYYVSWASMRTQETKRLHVVDHIITPEVVRGIEQEEFVLSELGHTPLALGAASIRTNNPFRDMLDEMDIEDMQADEQAKLPRIVLGQRSYFSSGPPHTDLFWGDINAAQRYIQQFYAYFGELTALAEVELEPVLTHGETATIAA